jgi:hypothetical protein
MAASSNELLLAKPRKHFRLPKLEPNGQPKLSKRRMLVRQNRNSKQRSSNRRKKKKKKKKKQKNQKETKPRTPTTRSTSRKKRISNIINKYLINTQLARL